jgi:hypothetical protein
VFECPYHLPTPTSIKSNYKTLGAPIQKQTLPDCSTNTAITLNGLSLPAVQPLTVHIDGYEDKPLKQEIEAYDKRGAGGGRAAPEVIFSDINPLLRKKVEETV